MTETTESETMSPVDYMAANALTVSAVFVPWSQSRNFTEGAKVDKRSLNWRVTLCKAGLAILTTDYSAGIGQCPSYTQRIAGHMTITEAEVIEFETEKGFPCFWNNGAPVRKPGAKPIKPDGPDVLYSLVMDSDVIDYDGFEDWAEDMGYDSDSRKAEVIFRACMETALKLRNRLGESMLAELREVFQDY